MRIGGMRRAHVHNVQRKCNKLRPRSVGGRGEERERENARRAGPRRRETTAVACAGATDSCKAVRTVSVRVRSSVHATRPRAARARRHGSVSERTKDTSCMPSRSFMHHSSHACAVGAMRHTSVVTHGVPTRNGMCSRNFVHSGLTVRPRTSRTPRVARDTSYELRLRSHVTSRQRHSSDETSHVTAHGSLTHLSVSRSHLTDSTDTFLCATHTLAGRSI